MKFMPAMKGCAAMDWKEIEVLASITSDFMENWL